VEVAAVESLDDDADAPGCCARALQSGSKIYL
jgi:hypothetical protein